MKKNNYLWVFFLFIGPLLSFANEPQRTLEVLYGNQVNATFSNYASLFFDGDDGRFLVPYTPGTPTVSSIFAGGLWLGLPTPGGTSDFKLSMCTYGFSNQGYDYGVGPLDATGAPLTGPSVFIFETIWKIKRLDVLIFLEDYNDNQAIDNPIPESILKWPGRGNPFIQGIFGAALPDQDLAPFFDRNNDGIYNPQDGDYPVLDPANPNAIPDEMLWYVFNDQYLHMESMSEPIGVEIQVTAYAFTCQETPVLNTTIFTRHKIINKSGAPLDGLKAGFWYDMDLGCYTDDYIGCDTTLNTFYAYNSDAVDGTSGCACEGGVNSYCFNPPVQAITLLNQDLASMIYYDNSSVGNPIIWPQTDFTNFSFLNGVWPDGTPLTYGGNGYNPNSTDYVSCAYTDNPNNNNGWSMITEDPPFSDRRSILSVPAYTLANFESVTIDMAYSFHRNFEEDNLGNVNVMFAEVPTIKAFYEQGFSTSCMQLDYCQEDCVWPGDANRNQQVEKDDYLAVGVAMGNQASGPQRALVYTAWFPQDATDWVSTFLDGTNQKHGDCNGDSYTDLLDAAVIDQNYTLTTPDFVPTDDIEASLAPDGIYLTHNKSVVSTVGTPLQRFVHTTVSLGLESNLVENIYGIAFTIVYDANILEPSQQFPFLQFNNSFFSEGITIKKLYHHPESNRIDFSFCRTDGENITNFGNLAGIFFQIREDGFSNSPTGMDTIEIKIVNVKAIDAAENLLDIGYKNSVIVATDLEYVISATKERPSPLDQVNIFPNPSSGALHFDFPATELDFPIKITLFDLLGHPVASQQLDQKTERWSWNLPASLTNGLYYLQLSSGSQLSSSRSLILHR